MTSISLGKFCKNSLLKLAENIGVLAGSSENDFLAIGENLQEFFRKSIEISEAGASAARSVSGDDVTQAIVMLEETVARVQGYLKTCSAGLEGNIGTLERVLGGLNSISAPLDNFNRVAMNLKALGFSMKIESAHLSLADQSYVLLANEITRQSKIIAAKLNDIREGFESLREQVVKTHDKFDTLKAGQSGREQQIIENMVSSLAGLTRERTISAEALQRLSESSRGISGNMGEVVSSMQFHDITRQQMEHVKEALDELLETTPMETANQVCRLQAAHLGRAGDDLVSAVENVIDNLKGIGRGVRKMLSDTPESARASGGGEHSFLRDLESNVTAAVGALDRHNSATRELSGAMGLVADTLDTMGSYVRDIEEIAESIRFIAINATIKALRMGQEGRALSQLALAIRELSDDARTKSGRLSGAITEIAATAKELREAADSGAEGGEQGGAAEIGRNLEELLETVGGVLGESASLLARMEELGADLIAEIERTADGITIHRKIRREIDRELSGLREIIESTARGGGVSLVNAEAGFDGLADRYTMESEREIHQAVLSGGEAGANTAAGRKVKEDEELGDNVELF